MNENSKFRIQGITKFDKLELQDTPDVSFEELKVPDGAFGEVVTLIAIFGASAITALTAFLLRKHDNQEFEEVIEEVKPDGTVLRKRIKYKKSSAEPPDVQIIKQLRPSIPPIS